MPSYYTHLILGERIFNKTANDIFGTFKTGVAHKNALNAFLYGAVLPDVAFMYKPLKKKNLGKMLHAINIEKIIEKLFDATAKTDDVIYCFLSAGIISHFALDEVFHPYINKKAKEFACRKHDNFHFELERSIDRLLYEIHPDFTRLNFPENDVLLKSKRLLQALSGKELTGKGLKNATFLTLSPEKNLLFNGKIKRFICKAESVFRLPRYLSTLFVPEKTDLFLTPAVADDCLRLSQASMDFAVSNIDIYLKKFSANGVRQNLPQNNVKLQ